MFTSETRLSEPVLYPIPENLVQHAVSPLIPSVITSILRNKITMLRLFSRRLVVANVANAFLFLFHEFSQIHGTFLFCEGIPADGWNRRGIRDGYTTVRFSVVQRQQRKALKSVWNSSISLAEREKEREGERSGRETGRQRKLIVGFAIYRDEGNGEAKKKTGTWARRRVRIRVTVLTPLSS